MIKRGNKWILRGIRNSNRTVLNYLYKHYSDKVTAFILSRNGSEKDAEDLFQEALLHIYEKAKDKNFSFTKDFESYLITLVKFMHHKQLRRLKTQQRFLDQTGEELHTTHPPEIETVKETRYRIILRNYFKLSTACMKVLRLAGRGFTNEQIATALNHSSEATTRVQKHRCMQYLAKLVKKDSAME